jgi:hypothetical protein
MLNIAEPEMIEHIMMVLFREVIFRRDKGNQTTTALSTEKATIIQADVISQTCKAKPRNLHENLEYMKKLIEKAPLVAYSAPYANQ